MSFANISVYHGITITYSGNTSNLTYHLQHSHQELLAETKGIDDKPGSSKDAKSLTQLTLGGTIAYWDIMYIMYCDNCEIRYYDMT